MEELYAPNRDRNESLGKLGEQLVTRQTYASASCGYKGLCFINLKGQHYKVNSVDRERWLTAISYNKTTIIAPPIALYNKLKA